MDQKRIDKKFNSLLRTVERFNNYLLSVQQKCDTTDVYLDKSSTCVSPPERVTIVHVEWHKDSDTMFLVNWQGSGENATRNDWHIYIETDEDGEEYFEGAYELVEDLKYMRKCINNGLRFWQAEDPDRFLEQDDDENED